MYGDSVLIGANGLDSKQRLFRSSHSGASKVECGCGSVPVSCSSPDTNNVPVMLCLLTEASWLERSRYSFVSNSINEPSSVLLSQSTRWPDA